MEKVFNVGFSKTATTSFEYAMEHLGYNTYHGNYALKHSDYLLALWIHKDYDEIKKLSAYWDAFADAPWGGTDLYEKLIEWYPNAKFVHTIRNAEDWYASLEKMFMKFDKDPKTAIDTFHSNGRYGFAYFFKIRFGVENLVGNKNMIINQYVEHNEKVASFMKSRKANYLSFKSTEGEGWEILCPFLGKPIPSIPYPEKNIYEPNNKILKQKENKNSSSEPGIGKKVANKIKRIIKG